jgi:hypothetical protein
MTASPNVREFEPDQLGPHSESSSVIRPMPLPNLVSAAAPESGPHYRKLEMLRHYEVRIQYFIELRVWLNANNTVRM